MQMNFEAVSRYRSFMGTLRQDPSSNGVLKLFLYGVLKSTYY